MTMGSQNVLVDSEFDAEAVELWIEVGWLLPHQNVESRLSEIDLSRAQLIHDLKHDLGVNDEGVPIILDLIDQLHGLRRVMKELLERKRV
jgi:chaperone modulatory protein CbpM